jgi:FK506-binding protein 2
MAAVKSKIAEAVKAAKVIIAGTDGDGQEHNEL